MQGARELARAIGVPLLVKAVGGGGGRGMKLIEHEAELEAALALAAAEAGAAFGDARVYLERYVAHARHVEVQLLGDGERVIHLGDARLFRSAALSKAHRGNAVAGFAGLAAGALHEAAVRFGARLRYRGAGTVEFLVDRAREEFFFLEMNARIQVEHPVTEVVTGMDLVAEQIAIAAGKGLRVEQSAVRFDGCAIECRVNAEDPARDFLPSPGTLGEAHWPSGEGIRVDTHIESGARVPPYYDSLLGKIIAHGPDRGAALTRARAAVAATTLTGVTNNLAFLAMVLADAEFAAGGVDTGFVARLRASHG